MIWISVNFDAAPCRLGARRAKALEPIPATPAGQQQVVGAVATPGAADHGGQQQEGGEPSGPREWSAWGDVAYYAGKWRKLPTPAQGAAACVAVALSGGLLAASVNTRFRCLAHKRGLHR